MKDTLCIVPFLKELTSFVLCIYRIYCVYIINEISFDWIIMCIIWIVTVSNEISENYCKSKKQMVAKFCISVIFNLPLLFPLSSAADFLNINLNGLLTHFDTHEQNLNLN